MSINFATTPEDGKLIEQIVERALQEFSDILGAEDVEKLTMDLKACHLNGMALDLRALLSAPVGEFGHDVWGINKYLDRKTGKLTRFFCPRYSLKTASV